MHEELSEYSISGDTMYVNYLEISGFKSFPERVRLHFSTGITAAIGPNGCGKSNLVDAIRWVLGEQSVKLLRGSKMEELIFNGTASRKAVNFAEVTLAFADADKYLPLDYSEVIVTRRLYRSGEGEYFLNKSPCRLKDISELFWDTGVGKETYSVIGQGRVDQLINSRPEERRELFEEAAEVSKYKQRKKEASSRIEDMKANLFRVEDLLEELKGQQEYLAVSAEKAREYKALIHSLKEAEKKSLLQRWQDKSHRLEKIKEEQKKKMDIIQEKKHKLDSAQNELDRFSRLESETREELEGKRNIAAASKERLQEKKNNLELLEEKEIFASDKVVMQDNSLKEIFHRITVTEETFKRNKRELKEIEKQQEELGHKVKELKNILSSMRDESAIIAQEEIQNRIADGKEKKAALEQKLLDNRERLKETQKRVEKLEEGLKNKRTKLKEVDDIFKRYQTDLEELDQKHLGVQDEQNNMAQRMQELQSHIASKKESRRELEQELNKKRNRLRSLQEHEEALSLYGGGVKAVMNASRKEASLEGVLGPVAHLIEVSSELERAIEVALGNSAQFIVTETDEAARKAINYLKDKKAGRATFLPLNLIKQNKREKIPQEEGIMGSAAQLVKTSSKFERVVDYLLGRVLVVESLNYALMITRKNKSFWRIVTLEGEMITPGGAITGGASTKEKGGFLQRRREIAELSTAVSGIEKSFQAAEVELQELVRKAEAMQKRKESLEQKGKILSEEIIKKGSEKDKAEFTLQNILAEIEALESEKNSLAGRVQALEKDRLAVNNEYSALAQFISELNNDYDKLNSKMQSKQDDYHRKEEELVDLRIRFSALQEKESSLQSFLSEQAQEKERLEKILTDLSEEKECLQKDLNAVKMEKERILKEVEEEKDRLKTAEEVLLPLEEKLRSKKTEKEALLTSLEKEKNALEKYERRISTLDLERVKLEEGRKYLQEQLLEKFRIDPQKMQEDELFKLESEEKLQEDKKYLQERLQEMGEVNPGVIEEYERLLERVKFLEDQRGDLMEGEKGIKKLLQELDTHMEERLQDTLRAVEQNFVDVFNRLFGGGQAFLKLTDSQNILESGIDIVAQPPGKKLQNIMLLSGGEKALTAIALLFAILQHKPTPFCVLDEIDSSLDETNLGRFLHFLKKYSGSTQFILITHRKKSMEEADALYGITMEEQGISKVVSLNMKERAG